MTAPVREGTSLRRSLSVWQAVGLSVALMAPSMAANINPQGTAATVGRATPLAFFLAAVAVLLIAYVFVRLCQYYRHAGLGLRVHRCDPRLPRRGHRRTRA